MSSLDARTNRIKSLKTTDFSSVSATLNPTEWSDADFQEYKEKYKDWLAKPSTIEHGITHAVYYLAAYMGIADPSHSEHIDTIKQLLPYLKRGDTYIFPKTGPKEVTTGLAVGTVNDKVFKAYSYPAEAKSYLASSSSSSEIGTAKGFWKHIDTLKTKDATSQQELLNLASFICLNMYRLTKKEPSGIYLHMPLAATKSYNSLFTPVDPHPIPPPSKKYVDNYLATMYAFSDPTIGLATNLVISYLDHEGDTNIQGVLKAACLLALAENGLGAIAWPLKVAQEYKLEVGEVLSAMCVDHVITSQVEKVVSACNNLKKVKTWPFCRLFRDTALYSLSTRQNPHLASLSALISIKDTERVLAMSQFAPHTAIVKSYLDTAAAIITIWSQSTSSEPQTRDAQNVIKCRRQFEGRRGKKLMDLVLNANKPENDSRMEIQDQDSEDSSDDEGSKSEDGGLPNIGDDL